MALRPGTLALRLVPSLRVRLILSLRVPPSDHAQVRLNLRHAVSVDAPSHRYL